MRDFILKNADIRMVVISSIAVVSCGIFPFFSEGLHSRGQVHLAWIVHATAGCADSIYDCRKGQQSC